MSTEHLESFQKGTGMGIRDGYYLATEHLRELADAVRQEGRLEAASAIVDVHALLAARFALLGKPQERQVMPATAKKQSRARSRKPARKARA